MTKKPQTPVQGPSASQGSQMGGGAQPEQPQQSGGSPSPQQGGPAPTVRYTDWASI